MSSEDLDQQAQQVVNQARTAFRSGETKSVVFRKRQLRALHRFLTEEEAVLKQALMDDLHKVGLL
jgi:acyl-CoA reductase-like NAD-dependent aldehyde dehydrogenase